MDDKQVLLQKSKEELVEIILVQEYRIKALEEKISGYCVNRDRDGFFSLRQFLMHRIKIFTVAYVGDISGYAEGTRN